MRTNRIVKFLALLAVLALLAPATNAKIIKINDPRDGSIRSGDTIAIDLNSLFSFQVENIDNVTCKVTQNTPEGQPTDLGHVYTGLDTPYYTRFYPEEYGKGSYMKFIDERSFIIFGADGTLIYQQTGVNGSMSSQEDIKHYKLSFFGNNVKCHDAIAFGHNQSQLIVGCVSANAGTGEQTLWLQILDRDSFTPIGDATLHVLNKDTTDFRVMSKLTLRTVYLKAKDGSYHDYVLLYDQQRQHVIPQSEGENLPPRNNEIALLFQVVEGAELEKEYELTFKHSEDPNQDFTTIYDFFWHNDEFALTTRLYRPDGSGGRVIDEVLYVTPCELKFDELEKAAKSSNDDKWIPLTLNCDGASAPTGIMDGHVTQMTGSSLWAIVDFKDLAGSGRFDVGIYKLNGAIDLFFSWERLNQYENIEAPKTGNFIENNWLRGVQGNESNFVLKWAGYSEVIFPHTNSDSFSTLISEEYGKTDSYPGWSANVHNGFYYLYYLESRHFAVVRIAGLWWYANGNEFNSQIDNIVSITCAEDQKSSASAMATIHQISKEAFRVDIVHWDPPYLEAFDGTSFRVPFGFNDYKAGNNVEFQAKFDDPIFHNTQVLHSDRVSVNFKPAMSGDKKTWDQIYFNYDAAATLDGTKLRMYDCEETMREIDCLHTGDVVELYDQTTQTTWGLYKDIFSGYKIVAAASRNEDGGTRKEGETRIYIVSKNGGTQTQTIPFYAESISFSMDTSNNFYVAAAFYSLDPKDSYVEVYKRTAFMPNSWEMIKRIDHGTLDAIDEYDFCPGQLHFDPSDPKMLHIMSHCALKGNKITRDKIYTQIVDASATIHGHGRVVPFEIVNKYNRGAIPNFCPFEDNFVIYSYETNTVLSIDKNPSISTFTIPLAAWQLSNFDNFDCMSRIGMFALSAINHDDETGDAKFHYGLFYGNQEYNADKYVNTILTDFKYDDWRLARSFPLKNMVMTVGFNRQENGQSVNYNTDYHTQGTLIHPPLIFTDVGHMDGSFNRTQEYTLTMTVNAGLNKASMDHKITALKEDIVIDFENHQKYNGRSGWVNLETFTKIIGPVKSISMTPSEQGAKYLAVRDRQWYRGAMDAQTFPYEFDIYRGDIHNAVALTSNEDGETFSIITEHEVVGQFALDGATAFDFTMVPQRTNERLIIFNHQDEHEEVVRAFTIDDTGRDVKISEAGTGTRADKLRVYSFLGEYISLGLDAETMKLTVWDIKGEESTINFSQVTSFTNVRDFDAVLGAAFQTLYVYYTKHDDDKLYMAHIWQNQDRQWELKVESSVPFDTNRRRWLDSLSCVLDDTKKGAMCAINTFGTQIYVLDLAFPPNPEQRILNVEERIELGLIRYETYQKMAGWDGDELYITDQYIVQKAWHMSAGGADLAVNALVWQRFPEGDGTVHTSIEINSGAHLSKLFKTIKSRYFAGKKLSFHHPRILNLGQGFGTTAISSFYDAYYKHTVIVGTNNSKQPMSYFSIDDFHVFIPEEHDDFDFAVYKLNIHGQNYSQGVSIDAMMTGNTPTPTPPGPVPPRKKKLMWWPFVAILVFLALASCCWFFYARTRQLEDEKPMAGEAAVYESMQPDSKVDTGSEFESGLNPNEDEDGLN